MARYARLAFADAAPAWYLLRVEAGGTVAHALPGAPWELPNHASVSAPRALAGATTLPAATPTKIVCVGRNYAAHAKELGNEVPAEPLLFHKPVSSLLAAGGVVELPAESTRVEQEAEIAFVVGRRVRRASLEEAAAAIFGYTLALDITARDLQRKDVQFTRGKGFDTFCPLGPTLVTADEFSLAGKEIRCLHAGRAPAAFVERQRGSTADMIFSVAEVLAYASAVMTFEPGDVILTGTPEGVGPLADGDRLRVEVPGLDALEVTVANEPRR